MEKGKFSQPRPYRDEERQIEEAFRQMTENKTPPRRPIQNLKETAAETRNRNREDTLQLPKDLLESLPDVTELQPPQPEEEPIEAAISREIEKNYPDREPPVLQPDQDQKTGHLPPYPEIPQEDFGPEEESEPEESLPEAVFSWFQKYSRWLLLGVFAIALVLILTVVGIFAADSGDRKEDDRILNNVMVAGVNVGGMTKEEAVRAVQQATAHTYSRQDMVVNISGTQILLSPQDTGASLDVKAAVDAAYNYGRTGTQDQQDQAYEDSLRGNHTVGLLPYLKLNRDFIRLVLDNAAGDSGSTLTQPSYGLEGNYPSLSVLDFDPASAQTLVLTMGTPGVRFDVDSVYDRILDAYSLHVFEVNVTDVEPAIEPDPIDLEAIYKEFYVEPVNDSINMQTFETIPGSYGYEFNLEEAQKLVDTAVYGQVLRIPMVFIAPEMLEENVLFRDVLGEYQTKLSGNDSLLRNVRLACEAIDGAVLQPGELFSFNAVVGEPTRTKGYQKAPVMLDGVETEVLGGGISQSATTLYCAALISDIEIVSRVNHDQPVKYVDMGLDAYVSWGGADLKLRNNGHYPVQIRASVSGSYVTVQLIGTESRDYFIKLDHSVTNVTEPTKQYEDFSHDNAEGYKDGDVIQQGYNGYTVKTYRVKYSRDTGRKMSSDYETTSRYYGKDTLIARVAPPETTVPETTVPETTVTEPPLQETQPPETQASEITPTESKTETESLTPPAEITQDSLPTETTSTMDTNA